MLLYSNIANETLGTTITTFIKGVAQIGTNVVDQVLGTSNGTIEMIAVGVSIAAFAWLIGQAVVVKDHAGRLF